MSNNLYLYAPLQKIENSEDEDDTVVVKGYASSEVVDSAGEIVTASAIRDALPDYFRDGTGALRERVAEMLKKDTRVKEFRNGAWNEGGTGVTLAEFA